jgi:NAD(P)H-flavin reductase
VIEAVLDHRGDFGRVSILYGARSPADLVYKDRLRQWQDRGDVDVTVTIDPGGGAHAWTGRVGFVPDVLRELAGGAENSVALVCGPPVMIRLTLAVLAQRGYSADATFTTLENRMKCGVGKCGRCNVGSLYICKDGPVFTVSQLQRLPQGDL